MGVAGGHLGPPNSPMKNTTAVIALQHLDTVLATLQHSTHFRLMDGWGCRFIWYGSLLERVLRW